jgi:iron-sulfur cluster assembly protein
MFQLTKAAADQVRVAAAQSGAEGMALRLAAQRKPNGAIDYLMGFDEVDDDDVCIRSEGVDIVIALEFVPLLDVAMMDFVEMEEGGRQFIFLNPKDPEYVPPIEN